MRMTIYSTWKTHKSSAENEAATVNDRAECLEWSENVTKLMTKMVLMIMMTMVDGRRRTKTNDQQQQQQQKLHLLYGGCCCWSASTICWMIAGELVFFFLDSNKHFFWSMVCIECVLNSMKIYVVSQNSLLTIYMHTKNFNNSL